MSEDARGTSESMTAELGGGAMTNLEEANAAAVEAVRPFLGGPSPAGDGWRFDLGEHLSSNWGAVFGGATAAAAVAVARLAAADRSLRTLQLQLVRSLPCGPATASARVRHRGRVTTTIEVELLDLRGKLAAIGVVTAVDPAALAVEHRALTVPFDVVRVPMEVDEWAAGFAVPPICDALQMVGNERYEVVNVPPNVTGTPAKATPIVAPWDDVAHTAPELTCLVADAANGSPIVESYGRTGVSWPNTDLSLRFTDEPGGRDVMASSALVAVHRGTTVVTIEVQAGGRCLGHGQSTSVLVPAPSATPAPGGEGA